MDLSSTNTTTICENCSEVQAAKKSKRATTPIAESVKRNERPVRGLRASVDPGPAPATISMKCKAQSAVVFGHSISLSPSESKNTRNVPPSPSPVLREDLCRDA
ncbi:hypothetical protein U1Q18_051100 [Sarracenia purpurea var. burkii]